MISGLKFQLAAGLAMASLLAACASKPPNMQSISSSADASQELETTQQMLSDAKAKNIDILAPRNYELAEKNLADAREAMTKGKNKEQVLEKLSESRGWLATAEGKGEVVRAAAGGISEARTGAIQAKADTLYPKEFAKIEDQTREATSDAEKGDLKMANKDGAEIAKKYHDLEIKSVAKTYVGEAQINMATAKKENSEKKAPKTFKMAQDRLNNANGLIERDPRNKEVIARAAAGANDMSRFLLVVTQKVKEGNTEDLVLQSEQQRTALSGLNKDYSVTERSLMASEKNLAATEKTLAKTEATLAQKTTALQTADSIRSQLKPAEAEVFVENNAVKVRLKGLQFASNKAVLNAKSTALLQKVDKALGNVEISKITVEGHTDSMGPAETNMTISQARAQAVQQYMITNGTVPAERVSFVGRGSESPISDNTNARGRAENRRIDLVIEPEMKATE